MAPQLLRLAVYMWGGARAGERDEDAAKGTTGLYNPPSPQASDVTSEFASEWLPCRNVVELST